MEKQPQIYNKMKIKVIGNRKEITYSLLSLVLILASVVMVLFVQKISNNPQLQTQTATAESLQETNLPSQNPDILSANQRLPVNQNRLIYDRILDVPIHIQERALSCEVATLKMALAYKGVEVSENELMEFVGFDPTPKSDNTWGDPHQAFVGDIDGYQPYTGYGVYWEPIARAGSQYRESTYFTNGTITDLTYEIVEGNPVIVWGNAASGRSVDWYTPDGKMIKAISGEHTLTVKGFLGSQENPTHIVYNDPHTGQVTQTVAEFSQQWSLLDNAGVIVK